MGEEVPDWYHMWGAKVKTPVDMPDDMLKDAINTSKEALDACENFETNGASSGPPTQGIYARPVTPCCAQVVRWYSSERGWAGLWAGRAG